MATYERYAVATVVSSQVLSHDETSILVEAGGINPTSWFLSHGETGHESHDEPPTKRRKTTPSEERQTDQPPNPAKNILLRRMAIDFHFPDTLSSKTPSAKAIKKDVDFENSLTIAVLPRVIDLFEKGTRLKLASQKKKGAVLVVDSSGVEEAALDAFRDVAVSRTASKSTIKPLKTDSTKADGHPATWSTCTLKRSHGQYTVVRLEASLYWRSGASAFAQGVPTGKPRVYSDYNTLSELFPPSHGKAPERVEPWSPQDFYDSVYVPDRNMDTKHDFEGLLESELYPFQKRAVHWLLRREGVEYKEERIQTIPRPQRDAPLQFFQKMTDFEGGECYVNHLQGVIQRNTPDMAPSFSGGLLAEEMGLGKTVELMALLCLHKRLDPMPEKLFDQDSQMQLQPSRATLIITPNTILDQWKSELIKHAPALKVFQYTGISLQNKISEEQVIQDLTSCDVVLATYQTLAKEIHFAEDPPDRAMRHERKFERKRSPLVQIQWWRICLDEAQMVESGVTAAAKVARRLPRVHSWAVSGTPLRKNVQDLHGLLIFLRYAPLCDDPRLWSHLITNHKHMFREIFGRLALRHTKAQIREDLNLPPQKRVVITVPFSAIEQQQYATLFSQMCEDVGVTSEGAPKNDEWDPEDPETIEQMRSWLVRLRQTCLHPQVGGKNRKALGRGQGPLRTVAEVLEVMIENNETNLRVEERTLLATQLMRAHIIGNNGSNEHRSEEALAIYLPAMETSGKLAKDARETLAAAKKAQAEQGNTTVETDDEDSSSESTPLLGRLRNSLRTAVQLQHQCTFFAATAYYNIKTNETLIAPDSDRFKELEDREVGLYEDAKSIRREILRDASHKSESLMRKITAMQTQATFTRMPKIRDLEGLGGIENQRIVEKSDALFDVLREQARVVDKWRAKMAEYLVKPLVDEDEGIETTGEEYEDSTKLQDELYAYFDAVKAMQADMTYYVTGEEAPLIDHEVKTMFKAAKNFLDPEYPEDMKRQVHAPELTLELLATRNKLRAKKDTEHVGSVRGLIQEARGLETSLGWGSRQAETAMVHKHLSALQAVFSNYSKALAGFEKEIDLFRQAQNQRLEFYRQLQEISDAVKPYKEELDPTLDHKAFEKVVETEEKQTRSLAQSRTKSRFLLHLREDSSQSEPKICVVCQCTFELGVLTVCGHQYCKECIGHWWLAHQTCPMCKRHLASADFHNITYKPQQMRAQEENQSGPVSPSEAQSSPSTTQTSIYSDVDSQLMNEIKSIDLPSSYGTKIDTLGRHLHWIREHDPGAKSIVFSQYRDFLDVLSTALAGFKIGYKRLGRSPNAAERFKQDPSIDCLLLDAKTDSSGLTLVNATHVFICEPLIQTAVELQAIARVHRIGQTRPTTVWMYLVNDTVEEAIYEISVARRLAHVQSRQEQQKQSKKFQKSRSATPAPNPQANANAIDAAETEELQSKPLSKLLVTGKGGGEVVGNEDLWQCLFGKSQRPAAMVSDEAEREVGRHLRAEAAEGRRQDTRAGASRA